MDTKVTIDLSQYSATFVNDLRLAAGREFRRLCARADKRPELLEPERERRITILDVMDTAAAVGSE